MSRIDEVLNDLKLINQNYKIPDDSIEKISREAQCAKVCVPVIGSFSTGKSALINTLLGYRKKLLREGLTPETAVPAEITYTDAEEGVVIVKNDGTFQELSVDEYMNYQMDSASVNCVRIRLRNEFLRSIPDVMIVDMPGFDSIYDIHDRAIDGYLPNSMAYIVAFSSQDMIVKESVGNILRELCLHEMPLCVVITKYDERNDGFNESLEYLKNSLVKYVGDREITYCFTSSYIGDAEELKEFLNGIQEQASDIIFNNYKTSLLAVADSTAGYLKKLQSGSELSESELDEEKEKLDGQLYGLTTKMDEARSEFDRELSQCIEDIKTDVLSALENAEDTFVAMVMNRQDIQNQVTIVVRKAVTVSVKSRLIPVMEKYVKDVSEGINSERVGEVCFAVHFDTKGLEKGIVDYVAGVAVVISALGGIFTGILAYVIAHFVTKNKEKKEREKAKRQIREKLREEVYPEVVRQVGEGIEMEADKQMVLINSSIDGDINLQKEALKKALEDLNGRMNAEKADKENLKNNIDMDLQRIEDIKDGLQ